MFLDSVHDCWGMCYTSNTIGSTSYSINPKIKSMRIHYIYIYIKYIYIYIYICIFHKYTYMYEIATVWVQLLFYSLWSNSQCIMNITIDIGKCIHSCPLYSLVPASWREAALFSWASKNSADTLLTTRGLATAEGRLWLFLNIVHARWRMSYTSKIWSYRYSIV